MAYGTLVVLRDATREHLARQAGNDFVAHVAHELKSPLNVIGLYGEMLADAGADVPAVRVEAINVIQDEVERMNSLVNNLLNVSKLEMGSMRPERHRVKLDDLLRDAWQQARTRAEAKGIRLDLQVSRELAAVSVDKDLFRIALNNLLNNSIKYNPAGGSVVLAADEADMDGADVLFHLHANPATADIPVLVLSADASPRQAERILARGAHAYLTKPLDVRRFLAIVDELRGRP
jgi:signal transduction histidine kinase